MIKSIRAAYELDGEVQEHVFEGKGTTHAAVRSYLRLLGATKIRTEIVAKIWNVRDIHSEV